MFILTRYNNYKRANSTRVIGITHSLENGMRYFNDTHQHHQNLCEYCRYLKRYGWKVTEQGVELFVDHDGAPVWYRVTEATILDEPVSPRNL